jgi:hypothetical protein
LLESTLGADSNPPVKPRRSRENAMQSDNVRCRINFSTRELEVAGSNQEVAEWWERLDPILKEFRQPQSTSPKMGNGISGGSSGDPPLPDAFGEYFYEFPSSMTDVEKILAAAYFVQRNESDSTFKTGQASKLLSENGIKLVNPSQCVKQNMEKKHVFAHNGKYRVSKTGIDHLKELKNQTS